MLTSETTRIFVRAIRCSKTSWLFFITFITLMLMISGQDARCEFPETLVGRWLSSNKGRVEFTQNQLLGFHPCREQKSCPSSIPNTWTCLQNECNRFLLKSEPFTAGGKEVRAYTCLYLYRTSYAKFVYYMGPKKKAKSPYDEYILIRENDPPMNSVCNEEEDADPPPGKMNILLLSAEVRVPSGMELLCMGGLAYQIFTVTTREGNCLMNITGCLGSRLLFHKGGPGCGSTKALRGTSVTCVHNQVTDDGFMYTMVADWSSSVVSFMCLVTKQEKPTIVYVNEQQGNCDDLPMPGRAAYTYRFEGTAGGCFPFQTIVSKARKSVSGADCQTTTSILNPSQLTLAVVWTHAFITWPGL